MTNYNILWRKLNNLEIVSFVAIAPRPGVDFIQSLFDSHSQILTFDGWLFYNDFYQSAISLWGTQNYILGYIICNDYSGRDLLSLKTDNSLLRKSSDGFLPIGPAIKLGYQRNNFIINTSINKNLIQSFDTGKLILSIEAIISSLSQYITLDKNDLICTGSAIPKPKVKKGDDIRITVDGLGELNSRIS